VTTAERPPLKTSEPEVSALGYEQARDELVDIVRRLEGGNLPLEESLRLWERGEALAVRCQEWLAGARATIESARNARSAD
jgi:exodeoxyribonuclease VII small subunit